METKEMLVSQRMLEGPGFICEGLRRGYSLEDGGEYHGRAMNGWPRNEYKQGE